MRTIAAILMLLMLSGSAQAYTCAQVRLALLWYGRAGLERLAVQYGITPEQRRAALACLRGAK